MRGCWKVLGPNKKRVNLKNVIEFFGSVKKTRETLCVEMKVEYV